MSIAEETIARNRGNGDQADALARLPKDLAIIKMEGEMIMAAAAAHPRDHEAIKRELIAQLKAYPTFAKAAVYAKPVGSQLAITCKCGHQYQVAKKERNDACPKCNKKGQIAECREVKVYARNLSVRAAEALAEVYGFNQVSADVEKVDADTVKVTATFTDFQRGKIWRHSQLVSKWYTDRNGKPTKMADDRFYDLKVKAEQSKVIREVITRSVPPGLRSELRELADREMGKLLDDATVNKMVEKFGTKQVTLEMLEAHLGRSRAAGWREQDRLNLLQIWNAIDDGEITVADAFYSVDSDSGLEGQTADQEGSVNLADLAKPSGKLEEKPEASESEVGSQRSEGGEAPPEKAATPAPPADQPEKTPLMKCKGEFAKCKTAKQAKAVYDRWAGPASPLDEDERGMASAWYWKWLEEHPAPALGQEKQGGLPLGEGDVPQ